MKKNNLKPNDTAGQIWDFQWKWNSALVQASSIKDVPKVLKIKAVVGFDGNGKNSCHRNFKNGLHFILGGVALKSIEDERGNVKNEETSLEADTEVPCFIIPKIENHMGTKNVSKSQKVKWTS